MKIFRLQFHLDPYQKISVSFLCLLLAGCLQAAMPVYAADTGTKPASDILVFSNGDKLAGHLDHEETGTVYFKSDNAGMVQIPWAKLKSLHTERPFAVIENGALVRRKNANTNIPVGTLVLDGNTLTVMTLQGPQEVPVKNVEYLIDKVTFDKNVQKRQTLTQGITGSVTAGASTVNSTQNSESVNTAVVLSRGVPAVTWLPARQRTLLNFSNSYGRITEPGTPTVKTNILHGGLEEDEYFSPRFYLLEQAMWDHNFSQGLDLQQLYGVGFGYTILKDPKQELDVTAVVDYTKQQFAPNALAAPPVPSTTTNLIGSSFGDNYMRKFSKKIVFTEIAALNPAWNSPSDYTANLTLGATFSLYKNLGFSLGYIDSYLNNPPSGFMGNSVQFTGGLTYTLP